MRYRVVGPAVLFCGLSFLWSCASTISGSDGTGGSAGQSSGTGGSAKGSGGSSASGGSRATGGSTGSTSSTASGTIVPLYTDPGDSSWNAIITAAVVHPTVHVVAIINPSDGPGSSKSSAYTNGIAALQAAHIEVIGYIATGYGSNSIASMESQMDQWKSFYPTLQGIFFDEQSNATSDVAHYQTLSQYAKSNGLSYLQNDNVPNPWDSLPSYFSELLTALE